MSDNPYESPAELLPGDFSTEDVAEARSHRYGTLIWTVLILDCIPCALRLWGCYLIAGHLLRILVLQSLAVFALLFGLASFGLVGNILTLSKIRLGIPLARTSLALALIGWCYVWWVGTSHPSPNGFTVSAFVMIQLFGLGWLILYGYAVEKAAAKLGSHLKESSPKEHGS